MTIEQAKEILEKWKYRGSYGLTDERLGYIEEWYNKNDDVAFEMAIKSLDMWDKVIKEIKGQKYALDYCFPELNNALDKSIAIIEKYKKEIEE